MKEAMFWKKVKGTTVQCGLCNHFCLIDDGKRGKCGVRRNVSGKLYSLVYGRAISEAVDPIEKKPFFHFLPGKLAYSVATVGCNFSCTFCQNWEISQAPKDGRDVIGYPLAPDEIVRRAIKKGCKSIAYTYTEPTVFFEYAYDTCVIAHEKGLKNMFVSNGFMSREAIDKIAPFLDAINVDLKGFSEEFYQNVVGGRLQPVLDNIRYLREKGVWVEVTTLVVPGHNDSVAALEKMAEFVASVDVSMPWHISRFFPNYRMLGVSPTPMTTLKKAYDIGKKKGLKYVYVGNVDMPGLEDTYCPNCGNVTVVRAGFAASDETDSGKCRKCGEKIAGVWE